MMTLGHLGVDLVELALAMAMEELEESMLVVVVVG